MTSHNATLTVFRNGKSVTVNVEADVDGDVVAIVNSTDSDGKYFLLDSNEEGAARCLIFDKSCPHQGWDRRAANLLRIAKEWPGF